MGVDAGYGEPGVVSSARILTGLSVDDSDETYNYHAGWHWTGAVKVLGFSDANSSAAGGEAVAMRYLDYLARHPSTARHLAHKLATHFVSDTPAAALVDRLAAVYLYCGYGDRAGAAHPFHVARVRRVRRCEDPPAVRAADRCCPPHVPAPRRAKSRRR